MSVSGLEMDYKWISNSLIISINEGVSEPKVASKRTKSGLKKVLVRTVKTSSIQYPNMIEHYDRFCQDKMYSSGSYLPNAWLFSELI